MTKQSPIIILLLFLSSFIFTTCKKGEGDPQISLRTRKARVVGNWRMQGGNASITINDPSQAPYNEAYLFDGSSVTLNVTEAGSIATVFKGAYTLNIEFRGDGSFSLSENLGGSLLTAKGTWNFLGRVGEAKNKERIVLTIESVSAGASNEHLFSKYGTEFVYSITKLRNKEMTFESATKIFLDAKGEEVGFKSEYRLVQ